MKKVVVASTNPVKISATELGITQMFVGEKFEVRGVSAKSEVSDQPMTEEETLRGANNRVNNLSKIEPDADYWIGIEGGLEKTSGEEMEVFAWIVIKSRDGKVGKGRTGSFFLPQKMIQLIEEGKELGEADDIVFGKVNSKQANGTVGALTQDVITRTTYYVPAIILALIPFRNSELY